MKQKGLNNVRGGDLRDADDYTTRFGWVWVKRDWEIFTMGVFFMLLSFYLLMDKFFMCK